MMYLTFSAISTVPRSSFALLSALWTREVRAKRHHERFPSSCISFCIRIVASCILEADHKMSEEYGCLLCVLTYDVNFRKYLSFSVMACCNRAKSTSFWTTSICADMHPASAYIWLDDWNENINHCGPYNTFWVRKMSEVGLVTKSGHLYSFACEGPRGWLFWKL